MPLSSILTHSTVKLLSFTRDLIKSQTFLPLSTFLHSRHLYLIQLTLITNSEMCSYYILSTMASSSNPSSHNNILFAYFNKISYHRSRSSSNSPHSTRSSAYKRPCNLHSLPSSENLTPILPIFITSFIYSLKNHGDMTHLCLHYYQF